VGSCTPQEREEELLGGAPDFVVDAIDNIDTKVRAVWSRPPHPTSNSSF
jgi:tRNA A37 threonylcarbamoyladenosine dehydratase